MAHRRLAADAWIFRFIDLGRDYLSRVEAHVILLRLRISENGSGKREWLGFVQPVGLVVAPPVLVDRGVIIDRNIRPHQERLDALLNDDDTAVADIRSVFTELLGWEQEDLADPAPEHQVRLPELDVTLEPTWQVRDREGSRQLLIRCEPQGPRSTSPSRPRPMAGRPRPRCVSSAYCAKLAFPPGCSARRRASVWSYTPAGETSGHITFRIADMAQVMGRPILAAFSLLLGEYRMFRAEPRERLGQSGCGEPRGAEPGLHRPGEAPGALPLLSDGTIWRVLERLLVLDGERLSYRTLDVEEIGSVYCRSRRKTRIGPGTQSWTQTPRHGLSHWMTRKTAGPDKSALDTAPAPLRAGVRRGRRPG